MTTRQLPDSAAAMFAALEAAATLAALDTLYQQWIGYSIVGDDPDANFEDVRDTLLRVPA